MNILPEPVRKVETVWASPIDWSHYERRLNQMWKARSGVLIPDPIIKEIYLSPETSTEVAQRLGMSINTIYKIRGNRQQTRLTKYLTIPEEVLKERRERGRMATSQARLRWLAGRRERATLKAQLRVEQL